jgi:hypothetical protein
MGAAMASNNGNGKSAYHNAEREVKIITVYFSGTDGVVQGGSTQISTFSSYTIGVDLTNSALPEEDYQYYKFAFDGCGVTNGMMGMVFAYGLQEQCDKVRDVVSVLVRNHYKIILNCFGLSRGGIAVLMLTQMLSHIPKSQLEMNILLFDPVPGNLITSSKVDLIGVTVANQNMDVSDSVNLRRVLSIYPYIPLPDMAFHAPIIPRFPTHSEVEEDVTLGCHQGALIIPYNLETRLSFLRIKTFLQESGTRFDESINDMFPITEHQCLTEIENEIARNIGSTSIRYVHSLDNLVIVREGDGPFLNLHHVNILRKLGREVPDEPNCYLKIRREDGSNLFNSMSSLSSIST